MISLYLSLGSVAISVCAFVYPLTVRFWLDRPVLNYFLRRMIYQDRRTKAKIEMLQLVIYNTGCRPEVVSRIICSFSDNGYCSPGSYNQIKSLKCDGKMALPKLLNQGEVFEFNLLEVSQLAKLHSIIILNSRKKKYKIKHEVIQCFRETGQMSKVNTEDLSKYF